MTTIWPEDRCPAADEVGPRSLEEIKRLFPPRDPTRVSAEQGFYMLLSDGELLGDESKERGYFNHSVILGMENYKRQGEFYKKHQAMRVDIWKQLYVDVMFEPTAAQRLAIGRMHRKIGDPQMAWYIEWLPKAKRTEGTLQKFFQSLDKALLLLAKPQELQ